MQIGTSGVSHLPGADRVPAPGSAAAVTFPHYDVNLSHVGSYELARGAVDSNRNGDGTQDGSR
jgi:hypothetical protein